MAVPPGDQNVIWSDGMRTRRSNNSVVVVVFIVIVIAALLAQRTRQVTGRNSPEATSQPSSQTAAVEPRIGPPDIYPDPVRTPGPTNPDITPDNIHENICNPNWSTNSIRPPVNYTNRLKTEQIQEYADADTNLRDFRACLCPCDPIHTALPGQRRRFLVVAGTFVAIKPVIGSRIDVNLALGPLLANHLDIG